MICLSAYINHSLISILVNDLRGENKQLEQGMKEILQAIQDTQKSTWPEGVAVTLPSLEQLVAVSSQARSRSAACRGCFPLFLGPQAGTR